MCALSISVYPTLARVAIVNSRWHIASRSPAIVSETKGKSSPILGTRTDSEASRRETETERERERERERRKRGKKEKGGREGFEKDSCRRCVTRCSYRGRWNLPGSSTKLSLILRVIFRRLVGKFCNSWKVRLGRAAFKVYWHFVRGTPRMPEVAGATSRVDSPQERSFLRLVDEIYRSINPPFLSYVSSSIASSLRETAIDRSIDRSFVSRTFATQVDPIPVDDYFTLCSNI